LQLRAAQNRRAQLTLAGVLLILLILAGIGYGVYRSYQDLPIDTAEQVVQQLDAEAVVTRLRQEIHARFQSDAQAARAAGQNWEAIRELESRRDAALGRVDEIILTIKEGLVANPSPIFIEATRILEQEGAEAAIAYLESHKTDQLARADHAAAQMEAARDTLQRELRPLILQAQLHETRLEWDQALALLHTVADKAPQWFEARGRLGRLLDTLARYAEAEPHKRAAVLLARTPDEEALALNNLAHLLQATNRLADAEPLSRQAVEILVLFMMRTGYEHPHLNAAIGNHMGLLAAMGRDEQQQRGEIESLIESIKSRVSP
jgi:tetratricopeptide (TPR) repeat protein